MRKHPPDKYVFQSDITYPASTLVLQNKHKQIISMVTAKTVGQFPHANSPGEFISGQFTPGRFPDNRPSVEHHLYADDIQLFLSGLSLSPNSFSASISRDDKMLKRGKKDERNISH